MDTTLVGQYSDSDRVSQSLQTPSRESKTLKFASPGRERERIWLESICSIRELRCKIGSVFGSHGGDQDTEEKRRRIDSPLVSYLGTCGLLPVCI